MSKPFKTIDEQIELLRYRGMTIGVIGHYVLLEGWLFGFLVRESRYFSWLGPTMRMDRSCCWKGDFSAL